MIYVLAANGHMDTRIKVWLSNQAHALEAINYTSTVTTKAKAEMDVWSPPVQVLFSTVIPAAAKYRQQVKAITHAAKTVIMTCVLAAYDHLDNEKRGHSY